MKILNNLSSREFSYYNTNFNERCRTYFKGISIMPTCAESIGMK